MLSIEYMESRPAWQGGIHLCADAPLPGYTGRMSRKPFSAEDAGILLVAAVLWVVALMFISASSKVGAGLATMVFLGLTVAIQRLLRGRNHAWPVAAILTPVVVLGCLAVAAFLADR